MAHQDGISGFSLTRIAPAKINLALHVVGQRADGYHLLESLVTFADAGDRIGFSISGEDRFTLSGRFSGALPPTGDPAGNLVLKARDLLRAHLGEKGIQAAPVHLHLEKNLPVASGIGGGSADAAATLLGLLELWGVSTRLEILQAIALKLGADVPMCLRGEPLVARGIGDDIERVADFPSFPMLIVNPLKAVSTPVIFRLLKNKTQPPLAMPHDRPSRDGWIDILKTLRNDLEPPARTLEPQIGAVSNALGLTGARLVRMSGSGASCFGLYASLEARDEAAAVLSRQNPGWYVLDCNSVSSHSFDGEEERDDRG
jgi:4-diphosphocytidyl-2-C-methyl-D-erythritol kinase